MRTRQRLYINIDHIATVRQARRGHEPVPMDAVALCEHAGADQDRIARSRDLGADSIELHTGRYAHATNVPATLAALRDGAMLGVSLGWRLQAEISCRCCAKMDAASTLP